MKIKRLFFDIETSPNIGLFWEPGYNISITHENIVKERAIICIGYKWAGDKKVKVLTWDSNQNDAKMLKEFIPIMNEADELVAHNGTDFDIKWIRTRALKHGIPVMPNYTIQDTIKLSRSRFKFNSNALDYISQFLSVGKKIGTAYDMWKKVLLNNDRKELKKMVAYCKHDVLLLERVWNKLHTYVAPISNFATHNNHCPECNSSNIKVNKKRITAAGAKKITFQCNDCGKYHTIAESKFVKGKPI